MRKAFVDAFLKTRLDSDVFLTGDLGFMALEPIQEALGPRFINAGVAEQNMVGAAAGLALSGMSPWCYSIAPFLYARCFEQIRNDCAMHRLPVKLIGNGGGYGYGVMGASHHALEDYGVLMTLEGLRVFVPAFDDDVLPCLEAMRAHPGPSYLRLGVQQPGVKPTGYSAWREMLTGEAEQAKRWPVIVAVGPLGGQLLEAIAFALGPIGKWGPSLWICTEPDMQEPDQLWDRFFVNNVCRPLWVVEEHVAAGSLGVSLASRLLRLPDCSAFRHFCAQGYPSGREGSQAWHRRESGIDAESVVKALKETYAL